MPRLSPGPWVIKKHVRDTNSMMGRLISAFAVCVSRDTTGFLDIHGSTVPINSLKNYSLFMRLRSGTGRPLGGLIGEVVEEADGVPRGQEGGRGPLPREPRPLLRHMGGGRAEGRGGQTAPPQRDKDGHAIGTEEDRGFRLTSEIPGLTTGIGDSERIIVARGTWLCFVQLWQNTWESRQD